MQQPRSCRGSSSTALQKMKSATSQGIQQHKDKKKKLGTGERAENQMVKITMSTIFNTTL